MKKWHVWQHGNTFLLGDFSEGQVSWATSNPWRRNLAKELQLEDVSFFPCPPPPPILFAIPIVAPIMLVYSPSHSGHDGDEGVCLPSWFCMVLISGPYLVCLCVRAWSGKFSMSWHYVNSMNWTVNLKEGVMGACIWFEAPIMHKISGLNLTWHWHVVCVHVQLRSHSGIICSGGVLFRWPTLVSLKKRVFCGLAMSGWWDV